MLDRARASCFSISTHVFGPQGQVKTGAVGEEQRGGALLS